VVASTSALPSSGSISNYSDLIELLGNPGTAMQPLQSTDVSVASLGVSTQGGVHVQGYAVTIPASVLTTSASAAWGSHTVEKVYVGPDDLVQRIVIPTDVTENGQQFKEKTVVTFTHYGAPLYVGPPPFSQMITLAAYQSAAAAAPGGAGASG
jgi:hypothetical protein